LKNNLHDIEEDRILDEERRTEALLTDIRELLDRQSRRHRQDDFSFLRLFSSMMQMLAMVALVWACMSLFSDRAIEATARLLLAIFLQTATLTLTLMDRNRG
jgi:carbon starvation protein CstA